MTQPKISLDQLDFENPNGFVQQYEINALTKTNAFQEVFLGGLTVAIDSANNVPSPDEFKVVGDYTETFLTGVMFHVSGSVGNDADYTTVADATFAGGFTTIFVTNGSITTNEGAGTGTGFISTGDRLTLPNDSTTLVSVFAVARDTTTTASGAGFIQKAAFTRDVGVGTVLRIGTQVSDFSRESMTGAPDVDLDIDTTNGSIKISFKGGSTNLASWRGIVLLQQLTL